jgi:hypothetical protein
MKPIQIDLDTRDPGFIRCQRQWRRRNEVSRNAGFGGSLFLIAVGAVLAFAVTVEAEGFNLNTIGIILMIVGALGAILTLVAMTATRKEEHTEYVKKDIDVDSRDH